MVAQFAPELLAEQRFDIRLVVDYQNKQRHVAPRVRS
jgi:hypothetical protein